MTPEQEVEFAAKLHYSFLPNDINDENLEISSVNLPLRQIGGDYHSIIAIDDQQYIICFCDVTGHSVVSALLAARINTYVTTHIEHGVSPCELITGLNEYLCTRISNTGTFTSFACMYISLELQEIVFGGAATPPVMYFNSTTGQVESLAGETIFLGALHPLPVECETVTKKISSGDKFVLCSDGVIETENTQNELWGIEPPLEILQKHHELTSEQINKLIMHSLMEYSQNTLSDDLTLITISIK